jgi:hypothetical protein
VPAVQAQTRDSFAGAYYQCSRACGVSVPFDTTNTLATEAMEDLNEPILRWDKVPGHNWKTEIEQTRLQSGSCSAGTFPTVSMTLS